MSAFGTIWTGYVDTGRSVAYVNAYDASVYKEYRHPIRCTDNPTQ